MDSPLYATVLALHVASAVAGFGALGLTGRYASLAARDGAGHDDERVLRYFRPGRNWASRSLLLTPLFGAALLTLGHGRAARHLWPWIGLAIWTGAVAVASARIWPAERAIQHVLAGRAPAPEPPGAASPSGEAELELELQKACSRVEQAASLTSVLFVAALVVMIWQPG